jgi:CubicO group peptidase (beta-lactamase class C family)
MAVSDKELIDWTGETILASMEKHDRPSTAIGLIRDGKIIYAKGFGTLSRNSDQPVTAESIFQIASVSKMFTGILVSKLIEEGKLDLNENVTTYLNGILTEQSKKEFAEITLAHLMQHKAGIPNYGCSVYLKSKENGDFWEKGYSEEELIKDINKMKLDFQPGSDFAYSNSGYAIVGYILERVTRKSYGELIETYITGPYEMQNTVVDLNDEQKEFIATPYPPDNPQLATRHSNWGKVTPGTGLFSTVDDLLKLMLLQLDAYQQHEKMNKMGPLVLTNRSGLDNEMEFNYGLGFFERKGPNGETIYQHDGDADGYAIFFTISPANNIGKVLITSSGGSWFTELDREIEAKIFNGNYIEPLWQNEIVNMVEGGGIELLKQDLKDYPNKEAIQQRFREWELNNAGYELIGKEKINEAIELFLFYTNVFPESANAFDSLGEAYMIAGQDSLAIKNYEKSLSINPENTNAVAMLKKLQNN